MHNILMLSYALTLRTKKYAEYLPAFGYYPIIVASSAKNAGNLEGMKIEVSKNYLPLNVLPSLFVRLKTNYRWLFLPDVFVTWIPNTLVRCWKSIKRNNVEIIYVSGGPFSATLIGLLLKKMTGLPLVVDFRDGWTLDPDPLMRYPLKLNQFIDRFLEKKVMGAADQIIAATNSLAEEYCELYPDLRPKITAIPNGFDHSEFPKQSRKSEKFTITYTGSLYGSGTRPYHHFFKAINHLISNGSIPPDKIQVFIVGSNEKRIIKEIERYQLQNNVYAIERLSQQKALEYTGSADVLLVIELTNSVTTKIYEYLSTGKPILAIIAKGELEGLISTYSDNSYKITSGNENDITRSILDAYDKWAQDALKNTNIDTLKLYCDTYNRKSLTGKLSIILDSISSRRHR